LNGSPYVEYRPDITLTLLIAAWQASVCRRAGAVGEDVTWQSRLVVVGDALQQHKVILKREAPDGDNDSGWYVGAPGGGQEATPSVLEGWQVWQQRPALVSVLCLPADYLVVVEGDTIRTIGNPDNQDVWSA
jgi:hypothetical protein